MPMPAHMTLKGELQGPIDGNCDMKGREKTILVEAFDHEVHIPHDIQTGLSAGKRVHGPFKIVKDFDRASPMMYQALCTGEHMTEVKLKFYRVSKKGAEEQYFTITLEDAIVVSVRPWMPNCLDKSMSSFGHMEEVAFTYRKVSWRNEIDKTEAHDDWQVPIE
ncbi:MAG: Hcp family type VI secretion system effector [Nitrospirae bacterium]|nr:Hcp family type VI secretion system effector [Nitrospirota bacterium]